MKILVNQDKCDRATSCVIKRVCPKGAVKQEIPGGPVTVDENICEGCGICISYCPHGAVEALK